MIQTDLSQMTRKELEDEVLFHRKTAPYSIVSMEILGVTHIESIPMIQATFVGYLLTISTGLTYNIYNANHEVISFNDGENVGGDEDINYVLQMASAAELYDDILAMAPRN